MVIDAPLPRTLSTPSIPSAQQTPSLLRPPSRDGRNFSSTSRRRRQFQIRRTRASDLDAISTMLATESVISSTDVTAATTSWNWNDSMKRLRAKSQLDKQLSYRLAAIEEGRKTTKRLKEQYYANAFNNDEEEVCSILSNDETCHLLWSNDNFRSKLKTAIQFSQEKNSWAFHNFDLTPKSDMLNHVMISVEDQISGEVVGFCEVAWLPSPTSISVTSSSNYHLDSMDGFATMHMYDEDYDAQQNQHQQRLLVSDATLNIPQSPCEETSDSYCDVSATSYQYEDVLPMQNQQNCAPAIVNLVTSSSHRRMGIASKVLNFASKYVNTQWSSSCHSNNNIMPGNTIGLYVNPENVSALELYCKKGFKMVSSEGEDGLLYMAKSI